MDKITEMKNTNLRFAVFFAVSTFPACAPMEMSDMPAIYVPEELEAAALAWNDVVELPADIVVSDVPLGPGIWLSWNEEYSGWGPYSYDACIIREAYAKNGNEAAHVWFGLTGAAASSTPIRVGTVIPPEDMSPTQRIDEDQIFEVKRGWSALVRGCGPGNWAPW